MDKMVKHLIRLTMLKLDQDLLIGVYVVVRIGSE